MFQMHYIPQFFSYEFAYETTCFPNWILKKTENIMKS